MKTHEIIFALDETDKIVITLEESLREVHCCYWAPITFVHGSTQYLLINDTVRYALECFVDVLSRVLHNQLKLHESIEIHGSLHKNIGYVYNEKRQSKSNFAQEKDWTGKYDTWVGYKYMLFGSEAIAWMYNDFKGDIFLELTPMFPGKSTDPEDTNEPYTAEEIANSRWYDEWIKTYKTILIKKIPREVAQKWLEHANEILETIEQNIQRMQAEGEASGQHEH